MEETQYYKVKSYCTNCKYEEIRIFKKGTKPYDYKCNHCFCERCLIPIGEFID